ncbi:hypothetical protein [Gemmatimonas phototrophica]|uniref:DUF4350 domain-containing protein n=1 Tax=Gemmatimonas phototrophica TaxID=1379270 RepID=A0A143BIL5_9BACT|nr:hypothetical protein [Gemmatimonas phototrophica]AMW04421.1 hypothetical protein GEMMAAP_05350 [Gemmatimonas phototrophica]
MNRQLFERACRAVAVLCLLAALAIAVRAGGRAGASAQSSVLQISDSVLSDTGARALHEVREWLLRRSAMASHNREADGRGVATDTLVLPLSSVPGPPLRAGLMSLRHAGVPVRWTDSTRARGLALSVTRVASPSAPLDVRLSAPTGGTVVLRDAGGVLDSVAAAPTLSWRLQSASPPLVATVGRSVVRATLPESGVTRRLLLLADPGWESKFVAAALEEAGWQVDGTFRVSPSGATTLGAPQRLDTARYAAVLILDSLRVDGAAIRDFVVRGGGVVLGGDALRIPALAAWRPARATAVRGAIAGALLTDTPRRGLEAWELEPVADAVVLQVDRGDHAHDEPALVARRVGAGRVVAMPYRESWRWRMQGTDDGMGDHRAWWTAAVAAAVPSPSTPIAAFDGYPGAAAPYADLVARVGAATAGDAARPATVVERRPGDLPLPLRAPVLLLVTLVALLVEWASRRLRGLR